MKHHSTNLATWLPLPERLLPALLPTSSAAATSRAVGSAPPAGGCGIVVEHRALAEVELARPESVLSGPLHPGSVFRWKSKGFAVTSTLREVTPKRRIAWTGKAFGTRAVHTWEIEESNQGTILKTAESFAGWLPRLMPRAMQRTLDETLPGVAASDQGRSRTHPVIC